MDLTANRDRNGLQQIQDMLAAGEKAPMSATLDFHIVEIEAGRVMFEGRPGPAVINLTGSVHGGYAATMLDSACGVAVHSQLAAGQGYTTLELKTSYIRGISAASGPVRAEGRVVTMGRRVAFAEGTLRDCTGRVCATASSTLLLFDLPPT